MLSKSVITSLLLTVAFGFISTRFKSSNFNLETEQRLFMMISNILLLILFGYLGSRLLNEPSLMEYISLLSIFYIIWYYITFTIVNFLSSDNNGVLRY